MREREREREREKNRRKRRQCVIGRGYTGIYRVVEVKAVGVSELIYLPKVKAN